MGPARGLGIGGLNPLGLFGMLARFGWKGILIGVVLVGVLMYSGGGGLCAGGGAPSPSQTSAKPGRRRSYRGGNAAACGL